MSQPTPFVVLRGGLVEHRSDPLTVVDMDILDVESAEEVDVEEVRNVRDQIQILSETVTDPHDVDRLQTLLAECNSWLHRHESAEPYTGRPVFEN